MLQTNVKFIVPVYCIVAVNLGASWIHGAGPENPIRQLADYLNLTLMITLYLCCQELVNDTTDEAYSREEYQQVLMNSYTAKSMDRMHVSNG